MSIFSKSIHFIKKFYNNKYIRIIRYLIYGILVIAVLGAPLCLIGLIFFLLVFVFLFYPSDPNTYAIIIAVIGSYIGLTSITFSAANSATDTDKKIVFSEIGERFLYSTVLLMFLLILRFMCLDVLHYNLFLLIYDPKTSPPDIATGNEIIAIFLNVVGYILGFILILFTWVGLEKMFKYIFKAFKKDYWERLR